ncbi:MAG: hypothetical protein ACE5FL_11515 [Myxococcota bacterium]
MPSLQRSKLSLVLLAAVLSLPSQAPAADNSLLLFGGEDHDRFLGCLSCWRSEAFSVWNEKSEYGSTTHPDSIWNPNGRFGAATSLLSPWNSWAPNPPIVVDRAGNLYGFFTRNPNIPGRITSPPPFDPEHTAIERDGFRFLAWLLDDYEWIIRNLDEVRADH